MYVSNKICAQEQSIPHVTLEQVESLNKSKLDLMFKQNKYSKSGKVDLSKLISDPSILGRYKNFVGASSKIANYIKSLDPKIRRKFIKDEKYNDYLVQSHSIKLEQDKIKSLIQQHNSIYTLNLKEDGGISFYNKPTRKRISMRVSCLQASSNSARHEFHDSQDSLYEISRIHCATQRGRYKKPYRGQNLTQLNFCDSPKSVPLQPIKRSQIYQILLN